MTERRVYTPTELNREAKIHLEAAFSRIWLEGEISNLSRPASGHLYFSLKDDRAQVRCALFRSAANRLEVQPENGTKVLASGRISLYEARGEYQMIVEALQHAGEGLLQQRFEALKKKLEEEGLFDPARKVALPRYPRRIGIITSPSGAAVRDMLHVLKRRWPIATVRIYPVPVQGEEAPPAIVRALQAAASHDWSDVILIGRGGGSLEDLWAFNDEQVARAIAACPIPLVSAVGHETDFSIADFVADVRAPTPSAAAELCSPDAAALKERFDRLMRQLQVRIDDRRNAAGQKLDHVAHRLQQVHPRRRLDEQGVRLDQAA
ncbi:MAG: exodeoxyribonuclease VII large subunit, partial [Xanthomonadales bacterium]|nr:exodeoxyribonuclease VII large subunit [Xanthomonadales bacterium]